MFRIIESISTKVCGLTYEPLVVRQGCKALKNRRDRHDGPQQREQYHSALYSKSMNSTCGMFDVIKLN
jgi:hypothetical protein